MDISLTDVTTNIPLTTYIQSDILNGKLERYDISKATLLGKGTYRAILKLLAYVYKDFSLYVDYDRFSVAKDENGLTLTTNAENFDFQLEVIPELLTHECGIEIYSTFPLTPLNVGYNREYSIFNMCFIMTSPDNKPVKEVFVIHGHGHIGVYALLDDEEETILSIMSCKEEVKVTPEVLIRAIEFIMTVKSLGFNNELPIFKDNTLTTIEKLRQHASKSILGEDGDVDTYFKIHIDKVFK